MRPSPPDTDGRHAARQQLIKLLAARLVREALAEREQRFEPEEDPTDDARHPLRPLQHRQTARDVDR
jgi:hypothetical protein